MKKILLILICFSKVGFSQTLIKKQTLIPLDNIKGVPYYKDRELNDLGIDGFEIDNKGNFYFLAGNKSSCLAVFSNNNKPMYRKIFSGIRPTSLYINKSNLYTFVLGNLGVNNLVELNISNGSIKNTYTHLTSKNITSYTFADSSVVIETLNADNDVFYQYNLKGKFVKQVNNRYNISAKVFPPKIQQSEWELVGMWNDNLIFWNTNPESTKNEKLCMVNKDGKILASKLLPTNFSGDGYVGNPSEDRKVRNGSLYVLGRRGSYALITEVPLKTFFDQ